MTFHPNTPEGVSAANPRTAGRALWIVLAIVIVAGGLVVGFFLTRDSQPPSPEFERQRPEFEAIAVELDATASPGEHRKS